MTRQLPFPVLFLLAAACMLPRAALAGDITPRIAADSLPVTAAAAEPRPDAVLATREFKLDDGSLESAFGVFRIPTYDATLGGVWLNRFAVGHATKIHEISIFWPPSVTNLEPGWQGMLVAYYDADMDGDPSNAVRLGSDEFFTIAGLSQWQSWAVDFTVPGPGDLYIGFVDLWARVPGGLPLPLIYAAATDTDNPRCQSYMIYQMSDQVLVNYDDLGANAIIDIVHSPSDNALANLMIRAKGDPLPGDDRVFTHGFDNLILCSIVPG